MIPRARPNYRFKDLLKAAPKSRDPGPASAEVAERLRDILGLPYVLLTPSGRGALYILLKATPGAEVLIPSYTCSAVAEAALLAGKQPIFAEHGSLSYNQSVDDLAPHLQDGRTYIATHQYGFGAPIEAMTDACRSAGVTVYEDIAAAFGTRVNGRLAGTFGAACFGSFDTTKLVNAPLKGGFLATADPDLFRRAQNVAQGELRTMSVMRKMALIGAAFVLVGLRNPLLYKAFHTLNFAWRGRATAESGELRTTPSEVYLDKFADWQAQVVLPQLDGFEDTIRRRRANYQLLRSRLQHLRKVALPPEDAGSEWAPIRFPVLCDDDKMNYYERGVGKGMDFGFSFTKIAAPTAHVSAHTIAAGVLNLPFDAALTPMEIETMINVLTELEAT